MTDHEYRVFIFKKDLTGRGEDHLYWMIGDQMAKASAQEIVAFDGYLICHDFWMIRDHLFDQTEELPKRIIDLDEFKISTSGSPEDRANRDKVGITRELARYGAHDAVCSAYSAMMGGGRNFDIELAAEVAKAMYSMHRSLQDEASRAGELERFLSVELPVYHVLQKAMSAGISVDSAGLSEKRKSAEHDYFLSLKDYSARHDMPLETPTKEAVEERLTEAGFELDGVSTEYVLEFLPHKHGFGEDTLRIWELDAARKVLSSLGLSGRRVRPIIDVFGSRTSRVHLRNPLLQNISKKYRDIIVARQNTNLCYVDFDQYEVGIMAALSGDPELTALYGAGDMYELFATTHLGIDGNRRAAKQLFLSYAFGMSRHALIDAAVALGADRARAKSAFRAFVKYEEWKRSIWQTFAQDGRISTMQGNHFKRIGSGPLSAKEQRSAVSQVVQGTASLIFKKAVVEVCGIDDVAVILPMHDALLFEHRLAGTPAKVVAAFEKVMTEQLQGRVVGKASIARFAPN